MNFQPLQFHHLLLRARHEQCLEWVAFRIHLAPRIQDPLVQSGQGPRGIKENIVDLWPGSLQISNLISP